ncbi:MAG: hypothetical protein ACLSHL_09230 [Alistipes communis]
MAKGSKAWYEVYERYIFEIGREETDGLKIPGISAGCLVPSLGDEQQPLFEESGPLLPLTAQYHDRNGADDGVVRHLLLHYIASIVCYIGGTAHYCQLVILALIPVAFLVIALSALYNKWGRSRSLTETI